MPGQDLAAAVAALTSRVQTLETALKTGQQTNLNIFDTNGIARVEGGYLAARGISAAGYKIRANDKNGNPIFDSDGLIAVMKSAGASSDATAHALNGGNGQTYPSSTTSFTVPTGRVQSFLAFGMLTGQMGNFAGNVRGRLRLTGGAASADVFWQPGNITGPIASPMAYVLIPSLAAGSYDVHWEMDVPAGASVFNGAFMQLDVFLLGG